MPPGVRNKYPIQRQPSPIAGQVYPTQIPVIGVFGQQPFETVPVNNPDVTAQTKTLVEQTRIQELPEGHREPLDTDIEIIAAEMLLKANRSPTDWKPITYTFDGENPQQVGRKVGRKTIVFFNGSANVTIAATVNNLSTSANEQFILTQGNSASIDTEGEFYMTAASGTTVSVLQTYWDLGAMVIAKRRTKNVNGKSRTGWADAKSSSNAN